MYALYTDNSILVGPDSTDMDDIFKLMSKAKLDITEEGFLDDLLKVNIDRKIDSEIHLT